MLVEGESRQGAAVVERLAAVIGAAVGALAGVGPGRLVSVSVGFPGNLLPADQGLAGDSRWHGAYDGARLVGAGAVADFNDAGGERFRSAFADWLVLGLEAGAPSAFFTLPPATMPTVPRIWVPEIAVRRDGAGAVVSLSAWWRGGAPEALGDRWLDAARRMFGGGRTSARSPSARLVERTTEPDGETWAQRVRLAAEAVADGRLRKVVLARRLSARLSEPADPAAIVERLARLNPESQVFSVPCGDGRVIAASPELLAVKRGRRMVSHALAGTTCRHGDDADDARAAALLLVSAKDRREHAVVVEGIVSGLAGICEEIEVPPAPTVMALRFLQHLWTPITGRLRPEVGLIDAVTRLHPTPAVLGSPAAAAIAWLAGIGEQRDGLYTGVVGWINRDGDGDAAVVLRSAYLEGRTARLWAGAGIVAGSEPEAEWAETEMKLASMLEVLNG